ncbi:nickel transporter permease [Veillonella seminalis]|uniref:ABC transporter permease n=1 Tax=Veillonella seminalis TaxID=1502943 RepID=A0A833FEH3_9FIRM|nr:nickel transporter permease [Veillonella seminalis]KAB1476672.1 ABC transporter permease [Veillonella seminalis]
MKEFIRTHKTFSFYTSLVLLVVLVAIFSPFLTPNDPFAADLANALKAPSEAHWFGTDKLGRDVLSRIIYGTGLSLFMGFTIVFLVASIGTVVGSLAGYFGGKVEMVLMRICDIMISFPGIILAIAIAGIMGGSVGNTILALTIVGWAKYARLVRSLVIKVRQEDYIAAAIMSGGTSAVILRRHVLPNIMPLVVVTASMDLGVMMLEIAGLSFLGFGAQAPTPEWGLMLNEGRQYLQLAPWLMIFPGAAILIVVSIFNLWSDSLRDILDPRQNRG